MYCKYCGFKVEENSRFCPNCGHEIIVETQTNSVTTLSSEETQEDKNAMIGFALGLASLSLPLLAIPGIIFSMKGKYSEKRKTLANVGLGTSIASLCLFVLFFIFYIFLVVALIR